MFKNWNQSSIIGLIAMTMAFILIAGRVFTPTKNYELEAAYEQAKTNYNKNSKTYEGLIASYELKCKEMDTMIKKNKELEAEFEKTLEYFRNKQEYKSVFGDKRVFQDYETRNNIPKNIPPPEKK